MSATANQSGRSPVNEWYSLIVVFCVGFVLWSSVQASSMLWSSTGWRAGDSLTTFVSAYANYFHPERIDGSGMVGARFGVSAIVLAFVELGVAGFVGVKLNARRAAGRQGFAGNDDLERFSAAAAVKHSEVILGKRSNRPADSATRLGREVHTRKEVWVSKELTTLVLAPPRSGKTTGLVAPAVADHRGPCLATGVRHDIMNLTVDWRRGTGPLYLCEPTRPPSADIPDGVSEVRWSPLAGCDDVLTARLRAEALFAPLPKAGTNDEYWRTAGVSLLAGYLFAAHARDGTIRDVIGWADRDSDRSPSEILTDVAASVRDPHERAAVEEMGAALGAAINKDPRYKAGVTGQVLQALEPFRLPQVRRMCDVSVAHSFSVHDFIRDRGTIWMLGSDTHQKQSAGVCTALSAAIIQEARDQAALNPNGRLQPPLLAALDEVVNVAPIPRLEQLLSTGGGSGIQTIVVLQSMAAARNAWGQEMGDSLLDFNNIKIVLGGLSDSQDLQDLSNLLGIREERVVQSSRTGRTGILTGSDYSFSWRQVPVLRPDEIRQIDSETKHHALVIARQSAPMLIQTERIYERKTP